MKKTIILLALAATAAMADEIAADYVEGEKSAVLVTPEIQAAASAMLGADAARQLLHAMRLQMSKYDADMRTQSGRRAWHGRLLRSEIHTNELCAVEIYTNDVDGAIWRYRRPFRPKQPRPPIPSAGIPARLAAARVRYVADEAITNSVTVEVTGNQQKGR